MPIKCSQQIIFPHVLRRTIWLVLESKWIPEPFRKWIFHTWPGKLLPNWPCYGLMYALHWSPPNMGPQIPLVYIGQDMVWPMICSGVCSVDLISVLSMNFDVRIIWPSDQVDRKVCTSDPICQRFKIILTLSGWLWVQFGSTTWMLAKENANCVCQIINLYLGKEVSRTLSDLLFKPQLSTRLLNRPSPWMSYQQSGSQCWNLPPEQIQMLRGEFEIIDFVTCAKLLAPVLTSL